MRTKDNLKKLEDINVIYQYLYLDEKNRITFNNGLADLTIRMNENFVLLCKNENFPDLEEIAFQETLTINYAQAMIELLKEQPAIEMPNEFSNRWEEIKTITCLQMGLNRS